MDQDEKPLFPNDTERCTTEYWIPVHSRGACDNPSWPTLNLPPMIAPWVGWQHSAWQTEWERFRAGDGPLPETLLPTGIELEPALRREMERNDARAAESLALWLAFRDRAKEALPLVKNRGEATARRVAGLILWKGLGDPKAALPHLEAGPLHDPIAVAELDTLYAEIGLTAKRAPLLATAPNHRFIVERRADLALATSRPEETIRLLSETAWPREHQRYTRTELWRQARARLGDLASEAPDFLNEDNLARFGAYWSDK
jgi:hypothetical protein